MVWFNLVVYLMAAYGFSTIVTQGIGPKNIFIRLRVWAENVGPNFGLLFRCMMCFPMNFGLLFALFNWFVLPFPITPFVTLFWGYSHVWYYGLFAALFDGCITTAFCEYAFNIYDYIDKSTPIFEDE